MNQEFQLPDHHLSGRRVYRKGVPLSGPRNSSGRNQFLLTRLRSSPCQQNEDEAV